jgi:haloacetate dehalogenase
VERRPRRLPRLWRDWATDVTGAAIDRGHFLPEEAPDETTGHLLIFLTSPPP